MKQIKVNDLTLEVEKKRIKNVYLRIVPPDGTLKISAPLRMSDKEIKLFVLSKLEWINSHRENVMKKSETININYDDGDQIPLWGNFYPLIVHHNRANKSVQFNGTSIELCMKEGAPDSLAHREASMNEFYRKELKEKVPSLIQKWERIIGVQSSAFTLRDMKSRWGSCNVKTHKICFNLQLAKKPPICLEYVVVHELVHLLEASHNHVFKGYMDLFLPDWRTIRKKLNETLY